MANAPTGTDTLRAIRVIDFGQYIAGPLTAMLLADHGADVIHVDPPTGPLWDHPANAILQRNKRAITLDLKDAREVAFAEDLIATADIVIENFRPGVMTRLGLNAQTLCARHPRLIWCSLPGFGHDDPRASLAAYEGIVCSAASLYPPQLFHNMGGPRYNAIPFASNFGGFVAAHSIVAALISRERYGRGDRIEVPLFDAATEGNAVCLENPPSIKLETFGAIVRAASIPNPAAYKNYKCRDGRMVRRDLPTRGLHAFWDRFMPAGLKEDTSEAGVLRAEQLLTELFLTKDAAEWERYAQTEFHAAFGAHQTTLEWLHDRHAIDSESVLEVTDPVLGETVQAGFVTRVSSVPAAVRSPRHLPGADNQAVRDEVRALLTNGRPPAPIAVRSLPTGAHPGAPLDGIRALDFTTLMAGPGSSRVLAEYGADVIKLTKTALGLQKLNPQSDDPLMYAGYRSTCAGKRNMFVDLKQAPGQEIAQSLAATADVVCINSALGMPEQMGIGEGDLRAVRPDIIYATTNLHGKGGWREGFRGHEQIAQAVTGSSIRFGGPEDPQDLAILINDLGTAHISAFGIMLAIYCRMHGAGGGATVEAALSRTSTLAQSPFMIDYESRDLVEPTGSVALGWSPYDRLYQCADGWLYIAAIKPDAVDRLKSIKGLQATFAGDVEKRAEELEKAFITAPVQHWRALLDQAGVPAHPYCDLRDATHRRLLLDRKLVVSKPHPGMAAGEVTGIVAHFTSNPDRRIPAAARLGYHTVEILEQLGYSDQQITELMSSEVVAGPMAPGAMIDGVAWSGHALPAQTQASNAAEQAGQVAALS